MNESMECDGSSRILSPRQGLPTVPTSISSVRALCWVGTVDTKEHSETLSLLGLTRPTMMVGARRGLT